jgi:predicted nucleic acid-binding protein
MTGAFVLDASIAAKWFLSGHQETCGNEAVAVFEAFARGEIRLLVPDLFWPEIGNVFWKAAKGGRMTTESAAEAVATLVAASLPTAPCFPVIQDAFQIAAAFGTTVYDAVYVALAVARNLSFLTADERLVKILGQYFPVLWVGSATLW